MPREYTRQPPPILQYDPEVTGVQDSGVSEIRAIDLPAYQMFDIIYGNGLLESSTVVCTGTLAEDNPDSFGIVASSGGGGPTYTLDIKYVNCDGELTDPFTCEWLAPTYCINSGDLREVAAGDFFLVANKENSGDPFPYNLYCYQITDVRNLASGVTSGVLLNYTATIDVEYITDSSGLGTADPITHYTATAPAVGYGLQYVTPMSISRNINSIAVFDG